jgi:hypothetical protein
VQWAVRAVLALGIVATVSGNVLHADGDIVSRVISAWPPTALLITIELIARVPVHRPGMAHVRRGVTAIIAGIAAWVSYWHMVAVASQHGETPSASHLIPVSVDGLVVVASVCLVELAGRIRAQAAGVTATLEADRADEAAVAHAAELAKLRAQMDEAAATYADEVAGLRAQMDGAREVQAAAEDYQRDVSAERERVAVTAAVAAAREEMLRETVAREDEVRQAADRVKTRAEALRSEYDRLRTQIAGLVADARVDPDARGALAAVAGLPRPVVSDVPTVIADVPVSKTDLAAAALTLTGGRTPDAVALLEQQIPDPAGRPHRSYVARIASRTYAPTTEAA